MAAKTRARPRKSSQSEVIERLERIERSLRREEDVEERLAKEEREQVGELEKLERLEKEIRAEVAPHPLKRITYHDVTKGLIGAFFGVVGHFAFFYGHHLAESFSFARATSILLVSILLLLVFLYFSGFRRVAEYRKYLPARAAIIFGTSIAVSMGVLFLFGILHFPPTPGELYREVAAVSVLAVMGAATADLIGGEA